MSSENGDSVSHKCPPEPRSGASWGEENKYQLGWFLNQLWATAGIMTVTGDRPRLMERRAQGNTVFNPGRDEEASQKEVACEISRHGGWRHFMRREKSSVGLKNWRWFRGLGGGTPAGWGLCDRFKLLNLTLEENCGFSGRSLLSSPLYAPMKKSGRHWEPVLRHPAWPYLERLSAWNLSLPGAEMDRVIFTPLGQTLGGHSSKRLRSCSPEGGLDAGRARQIFIQIYMSIYFCGSVWILVPGSGACLAPTLPLSHLSGPDS